MNERNCIILHYIMVLCIMCLIIFVTQYFIRTETIYTKATNNIELAKIASISKGSWDHFSIYKIKK